MKFLKNKIYSLLITFIALSGIFGLSQFVFGEDVDVIMTVPSTCGNSVIEPGEQCDDGNIESGDNCSATCQNESSCFLPGTKVLLVDGGEKNIEDLRVGDYVLGYNENLKINQPSKVLQTFVHQNQDYLLINDFLKVTDKHPIFINERWAEAGSAKVGDRLRDYLGNDILVKNILKSFKDSLVYNLEVENTHTYYADNILVHNKGDNTPPSIVDVEFFVSVTTSTVNWKATDSSGVSGCTFTHGLLYEFSAEPTNEESYFAVELSDLIPSTFYTFKITCRDSFNNSGLVIGSFTTESRPTIPDEIAPNILSYEVVLGSTTTSISWITNEGANEQINYGLDSEYSSDYSNLEPDIYETDHSVLLGSITPALIPNTTYHFQILGSDIHGNGPTSTIDYEFTTLKDSISPPSIDVVTVVPDSTSLVVSWVNPELSLVPDFLGVKVMRTTEIPSTGIDNGEEVYDDGGLTYTDVVPTNIDFDIEYFYTVFPYDTSLNFGTGAYDSGSVESAVTECDDGIDNDKDGKIDYGEDLACTSLIDNNETGFCGDGIIEDYLDEKCDDGDSNGLRCEAICGTSCLLNDNSDCGSGETPQCNDGQDNDGDTFIDLNDPGCSSLEDNDEFNEEEGYCGNGIWEIDLGEECDDGDSNGLRCEAICGTSCLLNDNSDCGSGETPQCNDGIDNDNDGFVDDADPGCESKFDNDESNPPEGDVPVIDFEDVLFKAGNKNIELIPINGAVTSIERSNFSISFPVDSVNGNPDFLTFRLSAFDYLFSIDEENQLYYIDISFPEAGLYNGYIEGKYKASGGTEVFLDSVLVKLNSLPRGKVISSKDVPITGVKVTLYQNNKKVDLNIFDQANPAITDAEGLYGWVVPNGIYYFEVEKVGYLKRKIQKFDVVNNVINKKISLLIEPPKLIDVIDPEASVQENIINVAENIAEKTKVVAERTVQIFQETVDNPEVEGVVEKVVAPVAVSTVVVTALPSIWFNLLNLLRFLFLQPLLLLGKRKRKGWGQVYNSLTKMPVDLATVRLLDIGTGRVIQSRVTDKNGRFIFSAKQGKYKIEVHKHGFVFPSVLLISLREDGERTDVYHGEMIEVGEVGAFITPNIPLDPEQQKVKQLFKIRLEKFGRGLQIGLSWFGLIVTVVSLYISPVWYMWVLLVVHLLIFFVFRRLAMPGKPKGWGVVYDNRSKKPIGKTIARLFDAQFNKLISTQVTDKKGRYSFLAGDNKYYVTFEHEKYETKNSREINLKGKKEDVVAIDVNLEKKKK